MSECLEHNAFVDAARNPYTETVHMIVGLSKSCSRFFCEHVADVGLSTPFLVILL